MAKVIGPLNSTEARGAVGALIYNTWRGIATVKKFVSPAQPRTERQLAIRAYLTQYVREWAGLTSGQRDGWNDYAADHPYIDWTGQAKRITGANFYCALSVRMEDMGLAPPDTAPVASAPNPVADLAVTGGSGQLSCAWTAYSGTDTTVDIWLYGPHSVGRLGKLTKARHNVYTPGETSPKVISGLTAGYYTIFARSVSETNGLASAWVSDTATVT